jgi:glutaredoxin 3
MKEVTIYSTPWCHFCKAAKEFMTAKGIEYTEHDVSTDEARKNEMIDMTGQMGVPVIVIGDEILIGFEKGKLAAKLGIEV